MYFDRQLVWWKARGFLWKVLCHWIGVDGGIVRIEAGSVPGGLVMLEFHIFGKYLSQVHVLFMDH